MWKFIKSLSSTKMAAAVRKNRALKSLVKLYYMTVMFPFSRGGVAVNIGGAGEYKLDYMFALSRYENFGDRHNAGFRKWLEACRQAKVVFDVGAHIGLYAIPASGVIPQGGFVYAFEPSATNRKYFKKHLEYNRISNIILLPYLVGDAMNKRQSFYESRAVDPTNSLNPKKNIGRYSKVFREQITLDNFAKEHQIKPDVIKIDVEGAEYNVLRGADEILKKYSPAIFLSVHPAQLSLCGASAGQLKDIISQSGYRIWDSNGAEAQDIEFGEYVLLPRGRSGI
ncbi:MAG: FkbM family methyltransferase [Candidatus Omnitrophica bacterium]|nr:FkbM family methyltransferase [Candidatus Omnitrophota bacterium]